MVRYVQQCYLVGAVGGSFILFLWYQYSFWCHRYHRRHRVRCHDHVFYLFYDYHVSRTAPSLFGGHTTVSVRTGGSSSSTTFVPSATSSGTVAITSVYVVGAAAAPYLVQ